MPDDTSASVVLQPYLFFRDGCFYIVELIDDADARKNAEINLGTLRVESADGRIVWSIKH